MFDVGWSEMLVILAVAVVVIGPKDLPKALYSAGKIIRKIKIFTSDIQKSIDRITQDEELAEITREANKPGGETLQFEIERQLQEENKKNGTTT